MKRARAQIVKSGRGEAAYPDRIPAGPIANRIKQYKVGEVKRKAILEQQ